VSQSYKRPEILGPNPNFIWSPI